MKKIWVVLLIIPLILLCGFKKRNKPIIILSSNPITAESSHTIENNFYAKSKIYFALLAKDGFKQPGVRLQISKQDDKTSNWGYSIILSKDFYVDTSQNVYNNYVYIQKGGHYILQFFYLNNKDYPFAHREFRVQE